MAKQPASERGNSSIARAGRRKWGYSVEQVDAFLDRAHALYDDVEPRITQEQIQNVSFSLEKNGYMISQVDATLGRLEKAVVDKRTQWDVMTTGRVAWRAETERLAHTLYGRAERPDGGRFARGNSRKPSYDRKQVDRLMNQIVAKIRRELGENRKRADKDELKIDAELTSTRVTNVIFTQRRGRRGYDERQVDAYLNRAVQVLSRLESYARLEDAASDRQPHDGSDDEQPETLSLFEAARHDGGAEAAPAAVVGTDAAGTDDMDSSSTASSKEFTDLRQTEAELFSGADERKGPAGRIPDIPAPSSGRMEDGADTPSRTFPTGRVGRHAAPSSVAEAVPAPARSSSAAYDQEPTAAETAPSAGEEVHDSKPDFAVGSLFDTPQDVSAGGGETKTDQQGADASPQTFVPDFTWDVSSSESPDGTRPDSGDTPDTRQKSSGFDFAGDDYLSQVLSSDTLSPANFRIPNLTFPSIDDNDDRSK